MRAFPFAESVPSTADQLGDRRRDEAVDRLAAGQARTHVGGRDGHRLDGEELDAVGVLEPLEHTLETLAREARARRDAEACELQHRVRLLPRQEVAELVGADQEQRLRPAALAQRVDRPRVRVELHLVTGKGDAREREPRVRVEFDTLVAGIGDDEDHEPLEPEVPLRALDHRDVAEVRRIEGPAEEADQRNSSTSSPTTTSSPSLTPAAFSAASSTSPAGGLPTTR